MAKSRESCIICQIASNNIPSYKIYEDDLILAVLDVNGANPGHCFVIPKNHYPIIEQVPDEEITQLFSVANKISGSIFENLKVQGTNIFVANGIPAGQTVAHFLINVIPRKENDGVNLQWKPKQLTDKNDLVLHTDMAGSPFFVISADKKEIPMNTIKEAADATCTFSRVWKLGLQSTDVFYVNPEQVSKKTKAGEYMGKGAFMIYGKTNYIENKINLAIGLTKDRAIMSGPVEAIKKNCEKYVVLKQGDEKVSSIAKKINYKLGKGLSLDEIIRALPAGEFSFK